MCDEFRTEFETLNGLLGKCFLSVGRNDGEVVRSAPSYAAHVRHVSRMAAIVFSLIRSVSNMCHSR